MLPGHDPVGPHVNARRYTLRRKRRRMLRGHSGSRTHIRLEKVYFQAPLTLKAKSALLSFGLSLKQVTVPLSSEQHVLIPY